MNRAEHRWPAPFGLWMAIVSGCASGPHRPYVVSSEALPGCARLDAPAQPTDGSPPPGVTPIVSASPRSTLHFLEFDDQGWPYPDPNGAEHEGRQIDCALADLERKTGQGPVLALVYVHGWNHSASAKDTNLEKFQEVLADQARLNGDKQVVGFYVAWNGDSLANVPLLRYLSFWSRKNAARHVAEGSVTEFFARLKALRQRANHAACAQAPGHQCPLRTIMVGHSFGGAILYASTAPYLMETICQRSA